MSSHNSDLFQLPVFSALPVLIGLNIQNDDDEKKMEGVLCKINLFCDHSLAFQSRKNVFEFAFEGDLYSTENLFVRNISSSSTEEQVIKKLNEVLKFTGHFAVSLHLWKSKKAGITTTVNGQLKVSDKSATHLLKSKSALNQIVLDGKILKISDEKKLTVAQETFVQFHASELSLGILENESELSVLKYFNSSDFCVKFFMYERDGDGSIKISFNMIIDSVEYEFLVVLDWKYIDTGASFAFLENGNQKDICLAFRFLKPPKMHMRHNEIEYRYAYDVGSDNSARNLNFADVLIMRFSGRYEKIMKCDKLRALFDFGYIIDSILTISPIKLIRSQEVDSDFRKLNDRFRFILRWKLNVLCTQCSISMKTHTLMTDYIEKNSLDSDIDSLLYALDKIIYENTLDGSSYKIFSRCVLEVLKKLPMPYPVKYRNLEVDRDGFAWIGRVYITPTRIFCSGPHLEVNNRMLRIFKGKEEHFVRISFCDEDLMPVYGGFRGSSDSILRRIRSILENGIRIGARKYEFVLFSSSQIRRASAWFIDYENSGLSRECILAKIGDVSSVRSPAKYSSIIGLSLSTTFEALPLKDHEFEVQDDICSSDKKFIFTDGCGLISFEFAQAISNRLNLNYVPSAFQIRFRGFKGMLVRSKIDYGKKAIFRKSMKKFEIPETNLEICSFSKAHPCFLNRQIIVLLTSLGVRDVIILDMYQEFLTLVRDCSLNRQNALNFLNIGCPGVSESSRNSLKVLFSNGFFEENDPFLIKGLESYKALSLLQLKTKSRIMVKNGALLKGVSDPSGILQEDEVILQLAQSSNLEPVRTILGNVVVTRNPCLHPGDIRVLKAVSPPEGFEYLVDVIVFSVKGSRDNPSKIAGGDLDGDEYSVYWDPRLMPDMIFEPMQEIAKSVLDIGHGVSKSDVIQFFLDSIKNASLGIICNAHQGWADHEHEGALSFECLDLAVLGSIAVDYPKTGIPAVIDRRYRLESFPDFMENRSKASYASHKVLGKIYRDVCKLIESKSSKFLDNSFEGVNPNLVYRGYENYLESAFGTKLSWDSHMFSIMSQNGIKHEEQLFFGTVQKFHRTYQKDRDIAVKVEQHIQKLKRGFRKSFFEEFIPNFNDLDPIEFDHCIRNLLIDPPKEMLEKASAWYVCAHSKELYENNWSAKSRLFSFPWIIFDVLVLVLQRTSKIE